MKPFSQDDEDLAQFLRQHRSSPPAAAPDLEDRIIQSLPKRRVSRPLILFTAGIAASFIGVMIAQPVRSPSPDAATLEAFMESSWSTVLDGTSDTNSDYLALVDSTN
ncbi:hypothetical protein H6F51_13495 [Cyanobacteria bacterium FACHB-DQ100]|uniref:hypothetical protein n=1 Tax=unclassified Leptolyngbya TaxID=2650499 RepID=UPI0016805BBA|nr:hypothetical protein [Leptolyngbya sp. FACHB-17]MBD1823496.1 hypothetical protein [Cyanobacteria bacterium FACHB-DQ100]MBD2080339.1 hypothetical protein [Leptolyngbya sp. FACHB-17]